MKSHSFLKINIPSQKSHRCSSIESVKLKWAPDELQSPNSPLRIPEPPFKLNQIFNSLKNIYDKETIITGIKKLNSVKDRTSFIDMLLKRREEINNMDELAHISKLGPIFERAKLKFMRKLKDKITLSQPKNRSSLFRKNSELTPFIQKSAEIQPKETNVLEQNNLSKKRATVLNFLQGFNERKIFNKKDQEETNIPSIFTVKNIRKITKNQEENPKILKSNTKAPLPQRKLSLGSLTSNQKHINHLQKDIFRYVVNNDNQNLLETSPDNPYLNKNVQNIDNDIKQILNNYKSSKTKDYKSYFKTNSNLFFPKTKSSSNTSRNKTKYFDNNVYLAKKDVQKNWKK